MLSRLKQLKNSFYGFDACPWNVLPENIRISQKEKKTNIEMLIVVPNSLKILVGSYICTVILMYSSNGSLRHVSLYISFYKINCFFAVPVSDSRSPVRPTNPQLLVKVCSVYSS